ncbi:hypothetical protein [Parahaliea mediterranea]|uniref:Uncharacterized protein n=1 Tax=Parahaliea mediterranea TaxID=651086 RepID=A0A939DGS9_9GAMM|nr:hypothetical protein [Parahaliea mediterranea]MBN7797901.1 hypothetical protein [Parahaliea mediterranea]
MSDKVRNSPTLPVYWIFIGETAGRGERPTPPRRRTYRGGYFPAGLPAQAVLVAHLTGISANLACVSRLYTAGYLASFGEAA